MLRGWPAYMNIAFKVRLHARTELCSNRGTSHCGRCSNYIDRNNVSTKNDLVSVSLTALRSFIFAPNETCIIVFLEQDKFSVAR